MADTATNVEENDIHKGLSVIDSLPANAATQQVTSSTEEEPTVVVKTEVTDSAAENVEVTETENCSGGDAAADSDDDIIILDDDTPEKDPSQSTLIITAEDLLDHSAFVDEPLTIMKPSEIKEEKVSADTESEEPKKEPVKLKPKKEDHSYFWVSNITRQVKAADLKKFFSQVGKVSTAKILTNGRNYYGYVSMNSAHLAAECISQLNNALFEGKKIVVSKDRPDLREAKIAVKVEPKKKRSDKVQPKKQTVKVEEKPIDVKDKKSDEEHSSKSDTIIADLKKNLEKANADVERYKAKVAEYQRRHDGMRKKCDVLERELKDAQYKMRNERRRLNQDREQFEKNKKLEQIRFEADRAVVNKELDEVRKLREHLKEKIEEFKTQSRKIVKRRSRSPRRNVRSRSPPLRNSNSANAFRTEDKKRKRDDIPRGRSPPPPPKLSEVVGKKRSDRGAENAAPSRSYFADEKRPSSLPHEYEFRHKSYAPKPSGSYGHPQEDLRGVWPSPFPKDPRRGGSGQSSSQNYPPEVRYASTYQFPSATISGPPRSYYTDFGKSYGPY